MYAFPKNLQLAAPFIAAGLLCAVALPVSAQKITRTDVVPTSQEYKDLTLELSLYEFDGDQKKYGRKGSGTKLLAKRSSRDGDGEVDFTVPIGTKVVMCVYASQAGVLSLWSRLDSKTQPDKLYPNRYTPSIKGGGPIGADEEVCVGDNKDFRLVANGKPGQLDLIHAHWTPDANTQLEQDDFPSVGKSARRSRSAATYGSASVQFRLGN